MKAIYITDSTQKIKTMEILDIFDLDKLAQREGIYRENCMLDNGMTGFVWRDESTGIASALFTFEDIELACIELFILSSEYSLISVFE